MVNRRADLKPLQNGCRLFAHVEHRIGIGQFLCNLLTGALGSALHGHQDLLAAIDDLFPETFGSSHARWSKELEQIIDAGNTDNAPTDLILGDTPRYRLFRTSTVSAGSGRTV